MSYTQPAFMVEHPTAGRSISHFNVNGQLTNDEIRMLQDYRTGDVAVWSSTSTGHRIQVDYTTNLQPNRLVIPAGHNLGSGRTISLESDALPSFGSPIARGFYVTSGPSVIDWLPSDLTGNERVWQVNLGSPSFIPEISEFWLGTRNELSASAVVWTNFRFGRQSPVAEVEYPGGSASVELAPSRRTFTLSVRDVDPAGADWTILDSVGATGRSAPFWYWPPDSDNPGPFLVKLRRDLRIEQDFKSPSVAVRYRVDLEMEEQAL